MQAPVLSSLTITTPENRNFALIRNRTATLSEPGNPFTLQGLTQSTSINGRTYLATFDAGLGTITTTSPEGRQVVATLDGQGREVLRQVTGLAPIAYSYDTAGRLRTVTQGTGTNARIYTFDYDRVPREDGFLDR